MARLTQPNTQDPRGGIIEVEGVGQVRVSPEFFTLPPDQQQAAVNEIRQDYGGGQAQPAAQPVQAPQPGEGVFDEGARGYLQDVLTGVNPAFAALNPQRAARNTVGLVQGAADIGDRAAELLQGGYNQTLGRIFGNQDYSATEANQGGGFTGAAANLGQGDPETRALGQIGMTALLTRGLGGPATQGAASGAILSEAEDPLAFAADVAGGAAGGAIGDRLVRGAQALIGPRINEAARRLYDRGVRITPGQASERLRRWEERRTSRPFLGEEIIEGRQQGYRDFNRVALEDVVAPVNRLGGQQIQVPPDLGHDAVRRVGDAVSDRYERLIPRLSMRPDADLATDITAVHTATRNGDLSPAARDQFDDIVQNQVMPNLNAANPIDGPAFRQIERRLGNQVARFSRSTDPDHQAMAESFREMQQAFQRALQRSNPAHAAELGALNESWANLVRVENAAGRAVGGLFTPGQFRSAVRSGDASTRRRAMARGEARMQQLADDAADVLPSQYPDSGTAGRQQDNPFLPQFWWGLAQSRAYSPEMQARLVSLMMAPRPPAANSIADLLSLLPAPQAGAFGANTVTGPLFSPVP